MDGKEYDSSKIEAFYLEDGDTIEMFSTTLHYCPCQISDSGFSIVVLLPKGTNTPLETKVDDKLVVMKNKWLICHKDSKGYIENGVYPGVYGVNHRINYK